MHAKYFEDFATNTFVVIFAICHDALHICFFLVDSHDIKQKSMATWYVNVAPHTVEKL